jgi:hypothetical protein
VPSDLSRKGLRRSVEKLIEVLVRDDLVASVDEIDVVRLELEQVGGLVEGRGTFGFGRFALCLEERGEVERDGRGWKGGERS